MLPLSIINGLIYVWIMFNKVNFYYSIYVKIIRLHYFHDTY